MPAGRPQKEFDKKTFEDLVGLGCTQEEICWFFRDDTGSVANKDTLSRWCKRTFGVNFQDYMKENGGMALKIKLRRNQFKLSERSASMAIFLGKNYLNQKDSVEYEDTTALDKLDEILNGIKDKAAAANTDHAEGGDAHA